jgi:ribose-phosphate pyrophosphokinase
MVRINGVKFKDDEFHNGEVIFEKVDIVNEDFNIIEMNFKDNKDITAVLFARQWLKDKCPNAKCDLVMKYCPYERMDREINAQLFSMKYFAEILAKFEFNSVSILDPHSEVCVDLLNEQGLNVQILDLESYVYKVIEDFKPDFIFYPDKGASKKYPLVLNNIKIPYFYGAKTRDLANKGRIKDYELVDTPILEDKKVLIIDDICCLGGTAYSAAQLMKEQGAKEVAFYISHCENGVFAGNLLKVDESGNYVVDKIYTADTMLLDANNDNITII